MPKLNPPRDKLTGGEVLTGDNMPSKSIESAEVAELPVVVLNGNEDKEARSLVALWLAVLLLLLIIDALRLPYPLSARSMSFLLLKLIDSESWGMKHTVESSFWARAVLLSPPIFWRAACVLEDGTASLALAAAASAFRFRLRRRTSPHMPFGRTVP